MSGGAGIVYVGCYTGRGGGRGTGIVAARRDPGSGRLDVLGVVAETPSPSFLARHPRLPVLYAVNELPDGTVSAWTIHPDGALTPLGVRSTGGADPCHLAVDPGGEFLYAANYGSGSVAVLPLDPAGAPGDRADLVAHDGRGPVPDRQEGPHAHMVSPDPDGCGLLAVDLGTDSLYRYRRGPDGRLRATDRFPTRPGTGPRHLARHPDGRRCFLAGELDASVTAYHTDGAGRLVERGRVGASRRPGHVQPSEIVVGPDGRFLYLANRGVGTVAVFALDEAAPRWLAEVSGLGDWPRHLALLGGHLYIADERADTVAVFPVDPDTGLPASSPARVPVPSPTCVLGDQP
ncbi:lactonase family protein [Micromonospora sp. WMMD1102]|uniref:lactonase family protein n=1 Tax=Micromonospora sp. WMMD1102 TaxID=3016105 RepID=UPI0024157AB0|nr:lactonase family protein [Micromonospora sp. WMMD1102]MDG4789523.1 lactonase family protein [Micromonospora sp. WMMD1102]